MRKILVILFGMILLTGSISAVCTTSYYGDTLFIDSGSVCASSRPIYILYAFIIIGTLTDTHAIHFHKTGGLGDELIVRSPGEFKLGSGGSIDSVTTSAGTCKYPTYGIGVSVGCPNQACMDCVCNTVGDGYCCGDDGGYGDIGQWDDICGGSIGTDASGLDCTAVC